MKAIYDLLHKLGVGRNLKGYDATATAVSLVIEKPEKLTSVTKELYPDVAKICNFSAYSVERNIRTAASKAWERNPELLIRLADYPMEKPPAASEFIDILARAVEKKKNSIWRQ